MLKKDFAKHVGDWNQKFNPSGKAHTEANPNKRDTPDSAVSGQPKKLPAEAGEYETLEKLEKKVGKSKVGSMMIQGAQVIVTAQGELLLWGSGDTDVVVEPKSLGSVFGVFLKGEEAQASDFARQPNENHC